jgi:hypothetical protein
MNAPAYTVKPPTMQPKPRSSGKKKRRLEEERADRQRQAERRMAVKPISYFIKQAQHAFNEFIRYRDRDFPCISCGRHHDGQYHAGHFRTTGASPELRFDEDNCHKQCSACNNHLPETSPHTVRR